MHPHEFQVVLVEPEIPQNTGSIGRLCLATQARLHLVRPLGFDISDSALKRAGLDYWEHLDVCVHESLESFLKTMPAEAPKLLFSKKAGVTLYDKKIERGTYFIFGKETAGLPDSLLAKFGGDLVRIPMLDARVRSLNLANAVSVGIYEGMRQLSVF